MPAPVYLNKTKKGRPCLLLSPVLQKKLFDAISSGMSLKHAAALVGVSYDTINRWRTTGEKENADSRFRNFCKALAHARSLGMQRLIERIQKDSQTDVRSAMWLLEKCFPQEFGKQRIEHSGPGGKPIASLSMNVEEARNYLSDESLKSIVQNIFVEEAGDEE